MHGSNGSPGNGESQTPGDAGRGSIRPHRGPPGRETAAARTNVRRGWYGYGNLARFEKSGTGMFLTDVVRVYGEVSIISLPALLLVWVYPQTTFFDVTAMALVAWMAMTLVGTLVRGGWVRPLATAFPGWVTLAPTLLVLRFLYFNLAILMAAFGGLALAAATGRPAVGLLFATLVAVGTTLLFPRSADEWLTRRR